MTAKDKKQLSNYWKAQDELKALREKTAKHLLKFGITDFKIDIQKQNAVIAIKCSGCKNDVSFKVAKEPFNICFVIDKCFDCENNLFKELQK